ncbi:MAG: helix-turn-helix domain-containing protein [Angelakisella sp.]
MIEDRKPAYWAILPAKVRYDDTLRPNAKLLYAEITALADAKGYCWATNEYLAQLFSIAARTVSFLISSLADKEYVKVEIIRDENNEIKERRIWVDGTGKNMVPPIAQNGYRGIAQNSVTPIAQNGVKNNIYKFNNTPIPPKGGCVRGTPKRQKEPLKSARWKPERFDGFWKYYPRGEAKQAAIRAWDKLEPTDALIATMGQALTEQIASPAWQRGIGIPYASSWINQRRWEDDLKLQPATAEATEGAWAPDEEVL